MPFSSPEHERKVVAGRNAQRIWTHAIRRALAHTHGTVDKGLMHLAVQMVKAAGNGDSWALQHIADRIEGKVKEQVQMETTVHGVRVDDARQIAARLQNAAIAEATYSVITDQSDDAPESTDAGVH